MTNEQNTSQLAKLLEDEKYLVLPKLGESIEGTVVSASRREVRIDIDGLTIGVVRGRELFAESDEYRNLKAGETIEATVIDLENENGEIELSFRFAGQQKAWEKLKTAFTKNDILSAKVLDANKGGLIIKVGHISGFLPVSQLSPEHYPRVSGGDKQKILEKLKTYVGQTFDVRILDIKEADEKLIVSEKTVWEERQRSQIAKYQTGSQIEGTVTALADFGAFVKFDGLEGLVHISEIAWQRIDHPRDVLKVGETVKAEIIGLEGSKIFLSMKKLIEDPWANVKDKYNVGDKVEGTVLKVNPFGFFVELDQDIHGLAHISELADKPVEDPKTIANEGEKLTFTIVSIEPKEHRLGLSLKSNPLEKKEKAEKTEKKEEAAAKKVEEKADDAAPAEEADAPATE